MTKDGDKERKSKKRGERVSTRRTKSERERERERERETKDGGRIELREAIWIMQEGPNFVVI